MLHQQLRQCLLDAISLAYPDLDTALTKIDVEIPKHKGHGDYACTVALALAKHLGSSPMQIAEKIVAHLDCKSLIAHTEIVAPGFINMTVDASYLTELLRSHTSDELPHRNETVLIEYSSPNIAKEMHLGHLLSTTIYGEAMKRILRHSGYHVIADNHLGDMGTQFGKIIYAIRHYSSQEEIERDPLTTINELYVRFHEEAEKKPELVDAAREESRKLEEGDEQNTALWKWICEVSMKGFQEVYDLLDVSFDTVLGESFFVPLQKQYVDQLLTEKIATTNPDGSIAIEFEQHGIELPSMPIMRSDGGSLYITRDIATIKYRLDTYQPQRIIYVVGSEQALHFQQLFTIARLLGWDTCNYEHMSYGLFRLKEGKMSTRKGRVILAKDVIEEGRKRVHALLTERGLAPELITELLDPIAIGAIKYSNFCRNRNTQSVFDWDTSLSFEGNSGPYLQYTYARSQSILRKANAEFDLSPIMDKTGEQYIFETDAERQLILHLLQFQSVIQHAGELLQINILAQYLYDLAALFNSFYNSTKVLLPEQPEVMRARLDLVTRASDTLRKGLELLSIEAPERM